MERADWLEAGFDPAQARFLMVTAITHHRPTSRIWGEREVGKLHAELAEIEASLKQALRSLLPGQRRPPGPWPLAARHLLPRAQEH